jgi:hypothetical protein
MTTQHQPGVRLPWWVVLEVLLGALLLCAGAFIALLQPAMMVSPSDTINGAVHVYAGYLASRNLALAIMLVSALALRARQSLGVLMVLIALVQTLDACMDCAEGRWMIAPGVVVFAIAFLFGAARVSGHAFWNRSAWN